MGKATKQERKKKSMKVKQRSSAAKKKKGANLDLIRDSVVMQIADYDENDQLFDPEQDTGELMILGDVESLGTKEESRGQIQQRHKREWKELKSEIQRLKDERFRLPSKRTMNGKIAKKEKSKSIKDLQKTMEDRHRSELMAWDSAHGIDTGVKVPEIVQQLMGNYMDTKEY